MSILTINNAEKPFTPVGIYSEQAGTDSGTWGGGCFKWRSFCSVQNQRNSIFQWNRYVNIIYEFKFNNVRYNTYNKTGSLFSVGTNGERNGFYTIDGNGINCTLELLDINNNVISTTAFNS